MLRKLFLIVALASIATLSLAQGPGPQPPPQSGALSGNNTWTGDNNFPNGIIVSNNAVTLYASPGASGDCLTVGTACDLPTACLYTRRKIIQASAIIINLAHGTYSNADAFGANCTIIGNDGGNAPAITKVTGDCAAPTAVILNGPPAGSAVFTKDGGEVSIICLQINTGVNGTGISGAQFSVADQDRITWGTTGVNGTHVGMSLGSSSTMVSTETIIADFFTHWSVAKGGNITMANGSVTTCSAARNFTYWATISGQANLNMSNWTSSGCGGSTGQRALIKGGFLAGGGVHCNSLLPGNAACAISVGGQTDANDPNTTPYVGTLLTQPIYTAQVFSNLVAAQGTVGFIADGSAAHCGDASCTTFGTMVTAGGGGLKLLVWYSGTNWTLIGR
jgi:hypothetical protein